MSGTWEAELRNRIILMESQLARQSARLTKAEALGAAHERQLLEVLVLVDRLTERVYGLEAWVNAWTHNETLQ
jgi:uncharacterized coiled-coil protein SlyX